MLQSIRRGGSNDVLTSFITCCHFCLSDSYVTAMLFTAVQISNFDRPSAQSQRVTVNIRIFDAGTDGGIISRRSSDRLSDPNLNRAVRISNSITNRETTSRDDVRAFISSRHWRAGSSLGSIEPLCTTFPGCVTDKLARIFFVCMTRVLSTN